MSEKRVRDVPRFKFKIRKNIQRVSTYSDFWYEVESWSVSRREIHLNELASFEEAIQWVDWYIQKTRDVRAS